MTMTSNSRENTLPTSNSGRATADFLTVGDLAKRWHCSDRHIQRLLAAGALAKVYIGRRVLIRRADILAYEYTNTRVS